jgi:hypothetical protein
VRESNVGRARAIGSVQQPPGGALLDGVNLVADRGLRHLHEKTAQEQVDPVTQCGVFVCRVDERIGGNVQELPRDLHDGVRVGCGAAQVTADAHESFVSCDRDLDGAALARVDGERYKAAQGEAEFVDRSTRVVQAVAGFVRHDTTGAERKVLDIGVE